MNAEARDPGVGLPGVASSRVIETEVLNAQSSRSRILEAAALLFAQGGYDGTSVASIARAASMAPANLYWHFPSKERLLEEVLTGLYESFVDEMVRASGPGHRAADRLRGLTTAYVKTQLTEFSQDKNFGYTALASSLGPSGQDQLRSLQRVFISHIKEILRQGIREGDFDLPDLTVTAFVISTCCEYVFTWYQPGGRLSVDEVAELYSDLVTAIASGRRSGVGVLPPVEIEP